MSEAFVEHQQLVNSLENALDFGRVISVFNTLLGILRDQQSKIDNLASIQDDLQAKLDDAAKAATQAAVEAAKAAALAQAIPYSPSSVDASTVVVSAAPAGSSISADLERRLLALEDKMEEVFHTVVGGEGDDSVLKDDFLTPYLMFSEAKTMQPMNAEEEAEEDAQQQVQTDALLHMSKAMQQESAYVAAVKAAMSAPLPDEIENEVEEVPELVSKPPSRPVVEPVTQVDLAIAPHPEKAADSITPSAAEVIVDDSPLPVSAAASGVPSAVPSAVASAVNSRPASAPSETVESQVISSTDPQMIPAPAAAALIEPSKEGSRPISASEKVSTPAPRVSFALSTPAPAQPVSSRGRSQRDSELELEKDLDKAWQREKKERQEERQRDRQQQEEFDRAWQREKRERELERQKDMMLMNRALSASSVLQPHASAAIPHTHLTASAGEEVAAASSRFVSNKADRIKSTTPSVQPLATPMHVAAPMQSPVGSDSVASTPHFAPIPPLLSQDNANGFRRKMDIRNLPFLTLARRKRIIFKLQTQGKFLSHSRSVMEKAKKKYAGESLKQRIDCLEADLMRMQQKMQRLQAAVKKNTLAIKESFPANFNQQWEGISVLLGYIESLGGLTNFAIKFQQLNGANPHIFDRNFVEETLSEHMRKELLQPMEDSLQREIGKYRTKIIEMQGEMCTKTDLNNMLKVGGSEANTDANYLKLQQVINRSSESFYERMESMNENKRKMSTLTMGHGQLGSGGSGHGIASKDLERVEFSMQKYTDERLQELTDELDKIQRQNALKASQSGEEVQLMREKINALEIARDESLIDKERALQARKEDKEALMILQKRISSLSVDRVMDDLRDVQKALTDRPSAAELDKMLKGVEETFQAHLGENVFGLKGLVQQVYKHIQNKVDREDIKKLISSKLGQMEREMIHKEEEMLRLASTTRCLSCGQVPNPFNKPRESNSSSARVTHSPGHDASSAEKLTVGFPMNDELDSRSGEIVQQRPSSPLPSLVLEVPEDSKITNSAYSTNHTEQVYALLTGQVGLKPIQLHHNPVLPRERGASAALPTQVRAEKIPEPLYRKAKMSQQIREMIKVDQNTLDQYGYSAAQNPLYVLDGSISTSASSPTLPQLTSAMEASLGRNATRSRQSNTRGPASNTTNSGLLHEFVTTVPNAKPLYSNSDTLSNAGKRAF